MVFGRRGSAVLDQAGGVMLVGGRWRGVALLVAGALVASVLVVVPGVSAVAAPGNVARAAGVTVSASSQNTGTGQIAVKAVDGSAVGYPGDETREWATAGGGAGSWIQLSWAAPVTIDRVVLYDRPNADDRVNGGSLVFSSGDPVAVGQLGNSGAATTVSFPARTVTSVRLNITSVSSTTRNVGLAEFEVWGEAGAPANQAPTARAGAGSVGADGCGGDVGRVGVVGSGGDGVVVAVGADRLVRGWR